MEYGIAQLTKKYGIKRRTVRDRFDSKYAKERWGVTKRVNPDGSVKRYVPEESLPLWEIGVGNAYLGRPVFVNKLNEEKQNERGEYKSI